LVKALELQGRGAGRLVDMAGTHCPVRCSAPHDIPSSAPATCAAPVRAIAWTGGARQASCGVEGRIRPSRPRPGAAFARRRPA
jgi:hypothetical protein